MPAYLISLGGWRERRVPGRFSCPVLTLLTQPSTECRLAGKAHRMTGAPAAD